MEALSFGQDPKPAAILQLNTTFHKHSTGGRQTDITTGPEYNTKDSLENISMICGTSAEVFGQ
ncbi:hypothetical protein PAMP_017074 [Pampus punctatissimus]